MSDVMIEKWSGSISELCIGATQKEGGSRSSVIHIGGQKTLPFLVREGSEPHKPVIAYEIWDIPPVDWPQELNSAYEKVLTNPLAWARHCVEKLHAALLCVRLAGAHPDMGDKDAGDEAGFIRELLKTVRVPLIILGCGDAQKDNLVLPVCSEAAAGERCIIGSATQDNYKTLTGSCIADGHSIIAESPIDINIAKQLNILISDMGLPLERIVIDPTIGALGYGLEYAYSIMERARLAALAGDKTVAVPFICFVGAETWRTKEASAAQSEFPLWGEQPQRGIVWEAVTAGALLQAGADILVMRHPLAVEKVKQHIDALLP